MTLTCYFNEPEYTLEEMRCIRKTTDKNVDDEEASSSEDDKDSSRLENLHWCTHCVIT